MAKQTDANIFDFKKIKDEMVAISDEVSKSLLKGMEDGTDPVTKKQKEVAREIEELKQKGVIDAYFLYKTHYFHLKKNRKSSCKLF